MPDRQRTTIEQPDGYPTVHLWENGAGEVWVCCASDHGPMCRLCKQADQLLLDLIQNVSEGKVLVRVAPDGEFTFKITAQGERDVEEMIATDPEMAQFYAQIATSHGDVSLNPAAEKVLVALREGDANIAALVESTGLTEGQVRAALDTLAAVGFIEAAE